MKYFWMFRRVKSLLFMMVILAFVIPQLGGSTGTITQPIGNVFNQFASVLGITGLVDAAGDVFNGSSEGKTKTSKATVLRVIDADTFEVQLASGKTVDLRLLAIDSPEKVKPNYPTECGAEEASAAAHRIAEGQAVKLTTDPTQDTIDYYGRWLRHAKINGKDYGLTMLKKGWVAPYVFDGNPVKKIDAYRKAAAFAKAKGRGVWGLCGGNFHSAADEPWSGD